MHAEREQHGRRLGALVGDLEAGANLHGAISCCTVQGAVARARATTAGFASLVTATSTVMPRLSEGKPVQVPDKSRACAESRAMATGIRSRLPTMPFVGSN